jgi:hypothetical protein
MEWTLPELTAEAGAALAGGRAARVNGRVRELPNERTVRWYVTIGLVDPPLSRRGRIALYGPRHLLQLVAVKRRQAEGRSIADIQAELAGATDETLRRIAGISPPGRTADARRFWAEQPAGQRPDPEPKTPSTAARHGNRTPPEGGSLDEVASLAGSRSVTGAIVHGLRLTPGATLLLDTTPSAADAAAILAAAGPLVDLLTERGLA